MSEGKNHSKQFERYLKGDMSPREAHAFERETLDDPFTQEALEGFENQGIEHLNNIQPLREKVAGQENKRIIWWRYLGVAAIVLITSYFIFFYEGELDTTSQLSNKEEPAENQLSSAPKPDTIPVQEDGIAKEELVEDELIAETLNKESFETAEAENEENYLADNESDEAFFESEEQLAIEAPAEDIDEVIPEVQIAKVAMDSKEAPTYFNASEIEPITLEVSELTDDTANTSNLDISMPESLQGEVAGVQIEEAKSKKQSRSEAVAARSAVASFAPQLINGKVTDESGEPLPGVNVIIKGTSTGTLTDIDGNYELVKQDNSTLVFAYVGFETQEVSVADRNTLDVTLGGATELQEVVVTGYGIENDTNEPSYSPATPNDGTKSYKTYLQENLNYPPLAVENQIEGTIVLQLTISSIGAVSDIEIKKSLGYGCDEEAIRLVKEGPDWNPANRNGTNVEDKVRVRVKFKL